MTLLELSVEYRDHARALDFRIVQLRDAWEHTMDEGERCMLAERIRVLSTMLREARELAVLCERYYDRGYRRNVKYTIWRCTPGRWLRTTAPSSAGSSAT